MSQYGNSVAIISKQPALSINVIGSVSVSEKNRSVAEKDTEISIGVIDAISNQVRLYWTDVISKEISLQVVGGDSSDVVTTSLFDTNINVYQRDFFGNYLNVEYGNIEVTVGDNSAGSSNNSTGSVSGFNVTLNNIIQPLFSDSINFEVFKDLGIRVASVTINSLPAVESSVPYNVNNFITRSISSSRSLSTEVPFYITDLNKTYMVIDNTQSSNSEDTMYFVDVDSTNDPRLINARVNNFIVGVTGESGEGSQQPAAASLESWF